MRKSMFHFSVILSVFALAACQQQGGSGGGVLSGGGLNKQDVGTVAGGVAGGVIGNQIGGGRGNTVATIAGTLIGAALGNQVGESLDRADMAYHERTAQRALETGQPGQTFPWQNTQTGHSGTVTPSRYYQADSGQYCREYTQRIDVGGRIEEGFGTACRQPDGSWKITQ